MKKLLIFCMLLATVVAGCSQNHFNVPTENFADRVRALGVAPIFVDANSDIRHPRKEELVALVAEMNRKYEQQFVRKIKATGNFFTIALLDGDAQDIFGKLFARREKRDDAKIQYNKYFWKNDELRDYLRKNNLDAVMLLVVSGLTKTDKVTSVAQFSSLNSDYNYLIMTAQIIDANGTILWEYPNFRQHFQNYDPLINLEYPDFNEAEANHTTSTVVKFKTIDGIRRTLEQKRKDLLLRETQESEVFSTQFDKMISLLGYDHDLGNKNPVPVVETARPLQPVDQPVKTPEMKPAAPAPKAPAVEVPAVTRVPMLEKPAVPTDEIVPAKGSTL
ncbi:MAG: hypothetical protein JJE30_05635 [Desulfuromonadales bacterium]|nr:hypothetical protein [Desulfuromonadales bacterium]